MELAEAHYPYANPFEVEEDRDPEPTASAPPRQRLAWYCCRLDETPWYVGNDFTLQENVMRWFAVTVQIVATAPSGTFDERDVECLNCLDTLCALLSAAKSDLYDKSLWFPDLNLEHYPTVNDLRRSFLREGRRCFTQEAQSRPAAQPRKSIEDLEKEGLSDMQIVRVYGWKTIHGGADLERLHAYREGRYTLTEADKYFGSPTPQAKRLPELLGVRRLFVRLRREALV